MYGMIPFRKKNNISKRNGWDLDSFFDEFFNDDFFMPAFFSTGNQIKADIRENDNEFIVEAEIPGVEKDDIKLELKDNTIRIAVERNEEKNEERADYVKRERRHGSFNRSFYVKDIKQEDVTAEYKDGVLIVTMPKLEKSKPNVRKIDIN